MVKPAYLIVSSAVRDAVKLKRYQELAIPLAKKAGMEVLAVSDQPNLLSGNWPFKGNLCIERFDSMQKLLDYRNSEAYRNAVRHVEGATEMDFAIAVEGE